MRRRLLLLLALLAPLAGLRARPRALPMHLAPGIELRGHWILKKGER